MNKVKATLILIKIQVVFGLNSTWFLSFYLFLLTKNFFSVNHFYQMPTLNRFDNYHECMGTFGEDALYCVSDTFIKPDNDSKLYKFIKEYSKDTKKHFRHDNLVRGLCVNSCKELIANVKNESQFLVERFQTDSKVSWVFDIIVSPY